jgi:hypothetical protein
MTPAAPEGTPPRRIREGKTALAPPCPERGPEAGGCRNFFMCLETLGDIFGASRDFCKVMAYYKKPDEKKVKWYATEIINDNGEKNLVWQLQDPTGWGNHTRIYREPLKPEPFEEKDLC